MKLLLLVLILSLNCFLFGQVKGLYVDGFSEILGNEEKEDSLLLFAKNNNFNYLTLYQMHIVNANTPLTDISTALTFANFVSKAKTVYDIEEIGVAVENFSSVNNVYHVYNQQHSATQKIDVYNLEFEFWTSAVEAGNYYCTTYLEPNGYACSEAGGFDYYCSILHKIDSLAALDGVKSEAYFGWFDALQGERIVQTGVDRVLLSAYIPSANYTPDYQYNYLDSRLENLASAEEIVKVISLHSAEDDFMSDYLETNEFDQPFIDLTTSFSAEISPWKQYIMLEGYQWFSYSDLPIRNMDLGVKPNSKTDFTIYPNPSNGDFTIIPANPEIEEFEIVDATGKCVLKGKTGITIQSDLDSGIYQIRIGTDTKKLIVN